MWKDYGLECLSPIAEFDDVLSFRRYINQGEFFWEMGQGVRGIGNYLIGCVEIAGSIVYFVLHGVKSVCWNLPRNLLYFNTESGYKNYIEGLQKLWVDNKSQAFLSVLWVSNGLSRAVKATVQINFWPIAIIKGAGRGLVLVIAGHSCVDLTANPNILQAVELIESIWNNHRQVLAWADQQFDFRNSTFKQYFHHYLKVADKKANDNPLQSYEAYLARVDFSGILDLDHELIPNDWDSFINATPDVRAAVFAAILLCSLDTIEPLLLFSFDEINKLKCSFPKPGSAHYRHLTQDHSAFAAQFRAIERDIKTWHTSLGVLKNMSLFRTTPKQLKHNKFQDFKIEPVNYQLGV